MKKIWYFVAFAPITWVCNCERVLTITEREAIENQHFAAKMYYGWKSVLTKLENGWHHPLEGQFDDLSVDALRTRAISMMAEYKPQMGRA